MTSIAPPIAPGDCAPFGASGFGHSIAFGNFDGDDYQDVAVGAHKSNGSLGRVYVFFGHAAFTTSPHTSWLGLNAPPIGSTNTFFGCMVAADDLDGDGKDELIVGRSERSIDVGRAYIIDGVWLTSVAGLNNLTTPPASSYQEIVNPQASFANPNDSFGWRVYAVGDVGDGATPGSLDGNRDVAIQGEVSDYDPTEYGVHAPSLPCPLIQNCGALWIYYNDGGTPGGGPPFVQSDPIPIYTPANVGCPQGQLPGQAPGRPGRAAARVEWLRDDDSLGDYLLVSEPERNVVFGGTQRDQAGQVYFIEIPIDQQSAQIDALGPAAFLEVGGPIAGSFFGSDIVTLDYKANPLLFPGQQIVVSSRQWRSGSLAKAGRAYSFTP